MLGETQWQWLEAQLREPADVRIFASSLQVLADFAGWEGWINYAQDHQRLMSTIRKTKANGLICLSGDTHYAEVSRLDTNVPYPMWDFTSSGLTEVWPVLPPNALRVGEVYRQRNFGLITLDWAKRPMPGLTVEIRGEKGQVAISQSLSVADLQVKNS
jgi:alkaline phosphatase D